MANQLELVGKSIFGSKNLIRTREISKFFAILLFLFSCIVSSMPAIYGLWGTSYSSLLVNHDNLDQAIVEIVKSDIDCTINSENKEMICDSWSDFQVGSYDVIYRDGEVATSSLEKSTILFTKKTFDVVTIKNKDGSREETYFGGTYSSVSDDLNWITKNNQLSTNDEYDGFAENFIKGIHASTISLKSSLIIVGSLFNTAIMALIIMFMFMVINYRAPNKVLKFSESFTIVSVIIFWAALATALIGLVSLSIATVSFIAIVLFRTIWVYVTILKHRKALGII